MNQVGLCMIVKNESHVIERCLNSVRDHIDHWVVVDTGSTDGTQDKVRDLLADVPGFLLERPWRDFAHNRTEALEAARPHAPYTFVIDADEVFVVPPGFGWPDLAAKGADVVYLLHRAWYEVHWQESLIANRLPWRYVGVLHEYLEAEGVQIRAKFGGLEVVGHFDGGRGVGLTKVEKYARDARTLEAALRDEPDNPRYQYYLARSYRASEQSDAALAAYRRRVEMGGGHPEEIFDCVLSIARVMERDAPTEDVISAYLRAWEYRPSRAEPLFWLARFCREQGRYTSGRAYARRAMQIPRPTTEMLTVDEGVYAWGCLDEFAASSYLGGDYQDSVEACRELLERRRLPNDQRPRVAANLAGAQAMLSGGAAIAGLTGRARLPVDRAGRPVPDTDKLAATGLRMASATLFPSADSRSVVTPRTGPVQPAP